MDGCQSDNYLNSLKEFQSKHGFTDAEIVEVARQEQLVIQDPCVHNYVTSNLDLSRNGPVKNHQPVKKGISVDEKRITRRDSRKAQQKAAEQTI